MRDAVLEGIQTWNLGTAEMLENFLPNQNWTFCLVFFWWVGRLDERLLFLLFFSPWTFDDILFIMYFVRICAFLFLNIEHCFFLSKKIMFLFGGELQREPAVFLGMVLLRIES